MKMQRTNWILRFRYLILLGLFMIITLVVIYFTVNSQSQSSSKIIANPDFIYNTWKIEKLYKNGKLVVNSNKYKNLFLEIHKNGTAEWTKDNRRLKFNFTITPDGNQIIFDDGMRIEEVETVFELRQNVLRFGKRTINSHYEYVFTAVDVNGPNFLE